MAPSAPGRLLRLADWYQNHTRPRIVLALVVATLYAPSLLLPFMVDDLRSLRRFRDYHAGAVDRLDLYEFCIDPAQVVAERDAGHYPWWIDPQLRYRFFRPLSQFELYGNWLLFGDHAAGYRVVSVAWYVLGVWLVLALFRLFSIETTARWAALVFALAGGHAIPVIFPAARCDLLALVASAAAAVCAGRFLRSGGPLHLAATLACQAAGMGCKEVTVALAVVPALLFFALRPAAVDARALRRRAALGSLAMLALSGAFLAFYARMHYASNGALMLDPLRAPADYLLRAPFRALLMLSTWLIQLNPFLFYFRARYAAVLVALAIAGAVCLALFFGHLLRRYRRLPGVVSMSGWSVIFLPILACTPADDRVMLLPSVGLAFLAAVWLTAGDPRPRFGRLPAALFLLVPVLYTEGTLLTVGVLEHLADRPLRVGLAAFGRPPRPGDTLFLLNMSQPMLALWTQDRLNTLAPPGVRVAILSDARAPTVERTGPRALRLRAANEPLLSTFVGQMGQVRGAGPRAGQTVDLGQYRVTIESTRAGCAESLRVQFARPLDDDRYRFILAGWLTTDVISFPAAPPAR
ncbi:MAG: hypothetical protein U1A27_14220 [Phycisphaerae bacterium]